MLVSGADGSVAGFCGLLLLVRDTRPPTPAPKISATPNFSLCLGNLVVRVVCLFSLSPSSPTWFSMTEVNQSDRHSGSHWRQQVARRNERGVRVDGCLGPELAPTLALDTPVDNNQILASKTHENDFFFVGPSLKLNNTHKHHPTRFQAFMHKKDSFSKYR